MGLSFWGSDFVCLLSITLPSLFYALWLMSPVRWVRELCVGFTRNSKLLVFSVSLSVGCAEDDFIFFLLVVVCFVLEDFSREIQI